MDSVMVIRLCELVAHQLDDDAIANGFLELLDVTEWVFDELQSTLRQWNE